MGAIVFGILALACYMACVKLSTERIVVPEKAQEKGAFMEIIKRSWEK